jgi:hypothetical protein
MKMMTMICHNAHGYECRSLFADLDVDEMMIPGKKAEWMKTRVCDNLSVRKGVKTESKIVHGRLIQKSVYSSFTMIFNPTTKTKHEVKC